VLGAGIHSFLSVYQFLAIKILSYSIRTKLSSNLFCFLWLGKPKSPLSYLGWKGDVLCKPLVLSVGLLSMKNKINFYSKEYVI